MPERRIGTWTSSALCVYELQFNEMLTTDNPLVIILLAIYLYKKIKLSPTMSWVTFVNLLNYQVQLTKQTSIGSLQLYSEYLHKLNVCVIETNQVTLKRKMVCYLVPHRMLNMYIP